MTRTEIIAKNILKYRKQKGLTQNDVANYLGLTRAGYANYERGIRSLSFETALQLGELFGISTTTLGYIDETKDDIPQVQNIETPIYDFTPKEIKVIKAYRKNPDMQTAVDRLLKIEQASTIKSFRAAHSADNHEPEIVEMEDLSKYPESDIDGI